MQLTEAEIEKIIVKALARVVWSTVKRADVLQVRGDWDAGAREAAHAIAEAEAEKARESEEPMCAACPYKQDMELIKKSGAMVMFP